MQVVDLIIECASTGIEAGVRESSISNAEAIISVKIYSYFEFHASDVNVLLSESVVI